MADRHWETVLCPHCLEGVQSDQYLNCRDRFDGPGSRQFRLVRCLGCGLIYLSPRPPEEETESFYQADGYDPFITLSKPKSTVEKLYSVSRRFTLRWKAKLVHKLVNKGGSILDLGCSTGEFLLCLREDYKVEGIEPEARAARFAREHFGLNAHTGTLDTTIAGLEQAPYDLITMWHVLEHIPNPVSAITQLKTLLKPGGSILFALPNIGSADAGFYGEQWVALDTPRHLWHFTPASLDKLMAKCGFKRVQSGMLPLDTFYNCLMSEQLVIKQKGKIQLILTPIRLPLFVTLSIIKGLFTGKHSGLFYIYRIA